MPCSDRPPQAQLQCRQSPDRQGDVRIQTRCYALKLPIAANTKTATFVYVDPGRFTDTELRSWGAAHEWLWRALRLQGIKVRAVVIGAGHAILTLSN